MRSDLGAIAVAGVVIGAALLGAANANAHAEPERVVTQRVLALGGANVGWIQSVEGGQPLPPVAANKLTAENTKYEDIKITSGAGMSAGFWDWIRSSLALRYSRKDGAVTNVDSDSEIVSAIAFERALLTEVGFPALDAASKDSSKLSLAFAPEHTRNVPKTGGAVKSTIARASVPTPSTTAPMTFRFDFAGCGAACKAAVKLAPVYVKIAPPAVAGRPPTPLTTSNIIVTMPPPPDLMKWAADGTPRDGTLEYVAGDGSVAVAFRMSKMKPVRVTVHQINKQPFVEIELAPQEIVSPK